MYIIPPKQVVQKNDNIPTKNSLLGGGYRNLDSLRTNNKNKKITY